MTLRSATVSLALCTGLFAGASLAKLPPPSDEAQAKAAEAAAKAAYSGKVAAFQLCQTQNRVASRYLAEEKKAGKDVKPVDTPACVDPGPAASGVLAPAPVAATPAAPPAAEKKK